MSFRSPPIVEPGVMRVAVVNLTRGGLSGGYRKYLRELMPLLRASTRVSELMVLGPAGAYDPLDWSWPNADELSGYRALRSHLLAWKPDVIFVPTARWIDIPTIPVVTMIRNMEPLIAPFSAPTLRERGVNIARSISARRAASRSTRVIAVSHFVRQHLTERWGLESDRIGVVSHGIDLDADLPIRPAGIAETPRPVVFSAGSIRPARGIEDLLLAIAELRARDRQVAVWFAGAPSPGSERYFAKLRRLSERIGVDTNIRWLGGLGPGEMRWCFENADLFVMTSRVEACPNTVLEAMAHGAASVSTDARPMPEFYGDAALFYRAGAIPALADRVSALLWGPDSSATDALKQCARTRAATFTWADTAWRTIDELAKAVIGFRENGR